MPKKKLDVVPEFKYEGFPVIVVHREGKELDGVVEHYSCSDNYTSHKKIIIKYDVKSKGQNN